MSANTEQTLSGITPVENTDIPFSETTGKVEAFLQKKFDLVIQAANKAIKEHNDQNPDDQQPYIEDVEVNLITTRMSSKFFPFILALPDSVLENKGGKGKKDELDIFNPQHTEYAARMKAPLFKVIKPYMYDNNDKEAFFTPLLQHELKISSRTAGTMKSYCRLRVNSFDKGRVNYVMVLLDPIRIFHNMASLVGGDKAPYFINIDKVEQIKGGTYRYHFHKTYKMGGKNKNKKDIDIERQILQRVSSRG